MAGRVAPPVWLDTARRPHRGILVLLLDEADQQLGTARLGGVTTPLCQAEPACTCVANPHFLHRNHESKYDS